MAEILIIDDDRMMVKMLARKVERMGHEAFHGHSLAQGLDLLSKREFDVVFLDVNLPDGNGLEALDTINSNPSHPEVIIITGLGDPDGAELAIRNGVWDYIEKASSINAMVLPLTRALQYREEKLATRQPVILDRLGIIGSSSKIRECLNLVAQASRTESSVLITGETGTGKELFSRAIHANSERAKSNFVVVDCAALPEKLVESLLFGHDKGAFTGADSKRVGLIKQADGGTLFLDEIGELSQSVQKSFLRVLQEKRFRPVGSGAEQTTDFRLIAATNRDLDKHVEDGSFRQDLLFRLRSFHIDLPPLRKRKGDVKELLIHLVHNICERYGIGTKGVTPEIIELLDAYEWPGNVRELIHLLERAISAAYNEPVIHPKHLPMDFRISTARSSIKTGPQQDLSQKNTIVVSSYREFKEQTLSRLEKDYLVVLMREASGNVKRASEIADLSRSRLYELLKRHGIGQAASSSMDAEKS